MSTKSKMRKLWERFDRLQADNQAELVVNRLQEDNDNLAREHEFEKIIMTLTNRISQLESKVADLDSKQKK